MSVAVKKTQLGAPLATDVPSGKYSYFRMCRCESSAAAPVAWSSVEGLQSISISPVEWGTTKETFQIGGGDESLQTKRDPKWSGQLTFLKGQMGTQLADFLGQTWTTAGSVAIPMYMDNDYPSIIGECILRDEDGTTALSSIGIPDMILDGWGFDNPLDESEFVLPFHTYRAPIQIPSNCELEYNVFEGDACITAFSLANIPLTLWTVANYRQADYTQMYYVKKKLSGETTGTLQRSGFSNTGVTVTATTAPADGSNIQILTVILSV